MDATHQRMYMQWLRVNSSKMNERVFQVERAFGSVTADSGRVDSAGFPGGSDSHFNYT